MAKSLKSLETGMILDIPPAAGLAQSFTEFLVDRQAIGLTKTTLAYYRQELSLAYRFFSSQGVQDVPDISPAVLRAYLVTLSETRNQGGIHSMFRALRSFFNWYALEVSPDNWVPPTSKVKVPAPRQDPLPGVPMDNVLKMAAACPSSTWHGIRDKAMLLVLVDSGARRNEFLGLNVGDVDLMTGQVNIEQGKGRKDRVTFLGAKTRRELARWLRKRGSYAAEDPLWVTMAGDRLTPKGLDTWIKNRAKDAGVPRPQLHDFRRCFAISFLRNGGDVYSLMRLMGHTSPQVLERYLALSLGDLQSAYDSHSPVDSHRGKKR